MFTFSNDIYKKIMEPIGLKYYVDFDMKRDFDRKRPLEDYSPGTKVIIDRCWKFLYPKEIIELFDVNPGVLSTMNSGIFDKKRGLKKRIQPLEFALKGQNNYLKNVYDHLLQIVDDTAAIETLICVGPKTRNSLSVNREMLNQVPVSNADGFKAQKAEFKDSLSAKLKFYMDDILKDKRFDEDIANIMESMIDNNPLRLVGLLCIFALFPEEDTDPTLIKSIAEQYKFCVDLGERIDNRNEERSSCDLTPSINITKESVLYRESEYTEIIDALDKNKSIVLSGFGGSGKTTLARLVFSSLKSNYDYCGWINYVGNLKSSMVSNINLKKITNETLDDNMDSDVKPEDIVEKKWKVVTGFLEDGRKSKIFVIDNVDYIDGVQNPIRDVDLSQISGWNNVKVIITSQLPKISGFDNTKILNNLGNAEDCSKCVELFYHYNPTAESCRKSNYDTVQKLCELAEYNTMVIELLAKDSKYYVEDLDEYYNKLMKAGFSCATELPVETDHDFNQIVIKNEDGLLEQDYYDRGNETAASQLMKLFSMRQRNSVERQILWDFHCLPEAENVSRLELEEWLGYSSRDIHRLNEVGWIQEKDGFFCMHPLVRHAISCEEPQWEYHWSLGEERREKETTPSIITMIRNHSFYNEQDSDSTRIRKILFSDCLSYEGRFLNPDEMLYIADYARKQGQISTSQKYYKKTFDELFDKVKRLIILDNEKNEISVSEKQLIEVQQFWESAYHYGMELANYEVFKKAGYYLKLACKTAIVLEKILPIEKAYILLSMSFEGLGFIKEHKTENISKNWGEANVLYRRAIDYREKLAEKYPDKVLYYKDYANTLNLTALFLANANYNDLNIDLASRHNLIMQMQNYVKSSFLTWRKVYELGGCLNINKPALFCGLISLRLTYDKQLYEEAEKILVNFFDIFKELSEKDPASFARVYTYYGQLLSKCGRSEDAKEAFEKAKSLDGISM